MHRVGTRRVGRGGWETQGNSQLDNPRTVAGEASACLVNELKSLESKEKGFTLYCHDPRLSWGMTTPLFRVMVGFGNWAMAVAMVAAEKASPSSMVAVFMVQSHA